MANETVHELQQKREGIVAQLATATADRKVAEQDVGAAVTNEPTRIAQAETALEDRVNAEKRLGFALESIDKDIATAKVHEANERVRTLREQYTDQQPIVLDKCADVEDATVALVAKIADACKAMADLNVIGRERGIYNTVTDSSIACYVRTQIAKVLPGIAQNGPAFDSLCDAVERQMESVS